MIYYIQAMKHRIQKLCRQTAQPTNTFVLKLKSKQIKGTINSEIKYGFTISKPKPVRVTCDRCNGVGRIPEYKHIENGICFKCRGVGSNIR